LGSKRYDRLRCREVSLYGLCASVTSPVDDSVSRAVEIGSDIVAAGLQVALADGAWQQFGFRRRPKWTGPIFVWFYTEIEWVLIPSLVRCLASAAIGVQLAAFRALATARRTPPIVAATLDKLVFGVDSGRGADLWKSFRFVSPADGIQGLGRLVADFAGSAARNGTVTSAFLKHVPSSAAMPRWLLGVSRIVDSPAFRELRERPCGFRKL